MATTRALTLSNSKSNTFRRCPKRYEFKYVYKVRPKRISLPLKLGDWMHQLLMVDADGMDWKQRHLILAADFERLLLEEREELGDLPTNAERLMKGYKAHYRDDPQLYRTVDTEINEFVDLPNGMRLNIIIDKIVEDLVNGGLWVWDYKNVSRFYPEGFMLLDTQMVLYFWGAKSQLGYKGLRGAILDELITKPPTLPKPLKTGGFERRKNLQCDAYTYYSVLKQAGEDPKDYKQFLRYLRSKHDQWWRRTRMPRDAAMIRQAVNEIMATGDDILKNEKRGVFPRTTMKECQWDCDYLVPCSAQFQGADISDILSTSYEESKKPDQEELLRLWPSQLRGGK